MKTFIIGCRNLNEESRFRMLNEWAISFGSGSFVEVISDSWLLRCNAGADDVHQCVEYILTEKVDFFIYELAEDAFFVQNVEGNVSEWTDRNL